MTMSPGASVAAPDDTRVLSARDVRRAHVCLVMLRSAIDIYKAFVGAMIHGAVPAIMPSCTPE